MARVLTKSEIDQLYDFVAVKDIPYYDVQSEIVDHLASLMEDRWAKGSQLNLEQMFLEVYKEFGEPEWREMWVSRQKAAWIQLWLEAKGLVMRFFRLPLLLWLMLALLVVQQIVEKLPEQLSILIYTPLVVQVGLLVVIWMIYFRRLSANRYLSSDACIHIFALEFWVAFWSLRLLYYSMDKVDWNVWLFATAYVLIVLLSIVAPTMLRIIGVRRSIARHRSFMKIN
ncbi:MAG: hypothetical protein HRU41_18065 [Saprospiraceae bacterium]|nr:hypothetical protein [Saprospiraceae bacterium]